MIPVAEPNLGELEKEYVCKAIDSNWVGPSGNYVELFEDHVAEISWRDWAVATTTGSAALEAAFWATGIKFSDVGIYSYPAARNALERLGILVNVVREKGISHDSAVYGANWPTVEDCAPALGVFTEDDATLGCYSFAANKTVTCGMGGAIVGDDSGLEARCREFIQQGHGEKGRHNLRMANLNAALGCAQLTRLDEFLQRKTDIWNRYAAAGLPMIERGSSRWMSTIELPKDWKDLPSPVDRGFYMRDEPFGGWSLPCSTSLSTVGQERVIECLAALY